MEVNQHHEELVNGLYNQLKDIFDSSEQAIYLYLDDTHKVCNEKFAKLLGYKSTKEWASTQAPLSDVVEEDQPSVVKAYGNAMEKMIASDIKIKARNVKTGKIIKLKVILVPIAYNGHLFALHFISK